MFFFVVPAWMLEKDIRTQVNIFISSGGRICKLWFNIFVFDNIRERTCYVTFDNIIDNICFHIAACAYDDDVIINQSYY